MTYRPDFDIRDGQLVIGGLTIERLAQRVGSTPFFAYDRARLDKRVALLRKHLPPAIELSYAVKANPMPALVQHLSGVVDSLDVASGAEMRLALDTPLPATAISFAGPGKSVAELSQAVASGVIVELESPTEASRIVEVGSHLGIRPQVAIRVNPEFEVKGSGMRMGGGAQQFGVDAEEVPALMRTLVDLNVDLLGFHVFAGSQNLHADILAEAQVKTVETLLQLAEQAPQEVTYLNLGGGFGIPYYDKESALDLVAVGANLAAHRVDGAPSAPRCPRAHRTRPVHRG